MPDTPFREWPNPAAERWRTVLAFTCAWLAGLCIAFAPAARFAPWDTSPFIQGPSVQWFIQSKGPWRIGPVLSEKVLGLPAILLAIVGTWIASGGARSREHGRRAPQFLGRAFLLAIAAAALFSVLNIFAKPHAPADFLERYGVLLNWQWSSVWLAWLRIAVGGLGFSWAVIAALGPLPDARRIPNAAVRIAAFIFFSLLTAFPPGWRRVADGATIRVRWRFDGWTTTFQYPDGACIRTSGSRSGNAECSEHFLSWVSGSGALFGRMYSFTKSFPDGCSEESWLDLRSDKGEFRGYHGTYFPAQGEVMRFRGVYWDGDTNMGQTASYLLTAPSPVPVPAGATQPPPEYQPGWAAGAQCPGGILATESQASGTFQITSIKDLLGIGDVAGKYLAWPEQVPFRLPKSGEYPRAFPGLPDRSEKSVTYVRFPDNPSPKEGAAAAGLPWPPPDITIRIFLQTKAPHPLYGNVGRVEVLSGITVFHSAVVPAPAGPPMRSEYDSSPPVGKFRICARDAQSRWGWFLTLNYPLPEHAAEALRAGRITMAQYNAIVAAHARGMCPPFNTPLGGQVGFFSDDCAGREAEPRSSIYIGPEDMEEIWEICPVGTPVTIVESE